MVELRLAPAARGDLAGIDEYGADQFGQDAADAYSRGFNEVFALLRRHPLAGAPSPKLGKNIRCIVHRKHRIFYRLDRDEVLILRIVHHARHARKVLNS